MKNTTHKKHTPLIRLQRGEWARYELGFVGAPCNFMKQWVSQIALNFKGLYSIAYLDEKHGEVDVDSLQLLNDNVLKKGLRKRGNFYEIEARDSLDKYSSIEKLDSADLTIVNANHFRASNQVVFIDDRKSESLLRKKDRLDNIVLILLGYTQLKSPPQWLLNKIEEKDVDVPIIDIKQKPTDFIVWVKRYVNSMIAPVHGLILNGGKSLRMGENKGALNYHGRSQVEYLTGVLNSKLLKVFVSSHENNEGANDVIGDTFFELGPLGGILSAFRKNPNVAYLTIAVDLPFVKVDAIHRLIENRDPSKYATGYLNPETGFIEPLLTIFEPRIYPKLLQFLSMGYSCPRKVLINLDTKNIPIEDNIILTNANTQAEKLSALDKLKTKKKN